FSRAKRVSKFHTDSTRCHVSRQTLTSTCATSVQPLSPALKLQRFRSRDYGITIADNTNEGNDAFVEQRRSSGIRWSAFLFYEGGWDDQSAARKSDRQDLRQYSFFGGSVRRSSRPRYP